MGGHRFLDVYAHADTTPVEVLLHYFALRLESKPCVLYARFHR